jgi:hypothetical protein
LRACFATLALSVLVFVTALPVDLQGEDAERLEVRSPDGGLAVLVHAAGALAYSVLLDGETLLAPSPISMTLGDGRELGAEPEVKGAERRSEDTVMRAGQERGGARPLQ